MSAIKTSLLSLNDVISSYHSDLCQALDAAIKSSKELKSDDMMDDDAIVEKAREIQDRLPAEHKYEDECAQHKGNFDSEKCDECLPISLRPDYLLTEESDCEDNEFIDEIDLYPGGDAEEYDVIKEKYPDISETDIDFIQQNSMDEYAIYLESSKLEPEQRSEEQKEIFKLHEEFVNEMDDDDAADDGSESDGESDEANIIRQKQRMRDLNFGMYDDEIADQELKDMTAEEMNETVDTKEEEYDSLVEKVELLIGEIQVELEVFIYLETLRRIEQPVKDDEDADSTYSIHAAIPKNHECLSLEELNAYTLNDMTSHEWNGSNVPYIFYEGMYIASSCSTYFSDENEEESDQLYSEERYQKLLEYLPLMMTINKKIMELNPSWSEDEENTRALAEIRHEQQQTGLIFEPVNFSNLIREVGQDYKNELKWEDEAFEAIQIAAEDYLIKKFQDCNRLAIHAGRTHITVEDMQLARFFDKTPSL